MSYTSGGLIEVTIKQGGDLNSLADLGRFAPGLSPVYIRGVAAIMHNTVAAAGVIKFDKRPTFGSDTNRGDGDVATLSLTTSHTGGLVVYKMGLNVKVSPGEEVVAEVTDVTGASDLADIILLIERSHEMPANIDAMVASA